MDFFDFIESDLVFSDWTIKIKDLPRIKQIVELSQGDGRLQKFFEENSLLVKKDFFKDAKWIPRKSISTRANRWIPKNIMKIEKKLESVRKPKGFTYEFEENSSDFQKVVKEIQKKSAIIEFFEREDVFAPGDFVAHEIIPEELNVLSNGYSG